MRKERIGFVWLSLLLLSAPPAGAIPIPVLNLADQVRNSDLIVVGRVTGSQETGRANIDADKQSIPARRMIASLQIERVIKGRPGETTISVAYVVPETPLGYARIAIAQFGMFFLRKAPGQVYGFVSPYYPFVVASAIPPGAEGTDFDRVIAEVAQVLIVPGTSVDERRHATALISRLKTNRSIEALRLAVRDADTSVRLNAAAALLRTDDVQVLASVEDILTNPPRNIEPALLNGLALAIQEGIRKQEAIPMLARLLRAQEVGTRRAAATALRHTEADGAIGPLVIALQDIDREVRYQAVLGLAVITGETDWAPAFNQFEREEQRYLTHWREWAKGR